MTRPAILGAIGSTAPVSWENRYPAAVSPTVALQRNLLAQLHRAELPLEKTWTVLPVRRWPRDRLSLLRPSAEERSEAGSGVRFLGASNLEPFKTVTIALDLVASLARWGRASRRAGKRPFLLCYNLGPTHQQVFPVWFGAWLGGIRAATLVTDLDAAEPSEGPLARFRYRYQLAGIRRFERLLVLNRRVLEDCCWNGPEPFAFPGILPDDTFVAKLAELNEPDRTGERFLYAGSLNALRGIDRLLEAFAGWERPSARLTVTGAGPLESTVRKAAAADPRIHFAGFLTPHEDRVAAYAEADFVVNPHRVGSLASRSVFPSKVAEAMASGRPVLSTRVSGLEAEPPERLLFAEGDDAPAIRALLEEAVLLPPETRRRIGASARDHVLRNLTWDRLGPLVADWIRRWMEESR